MPDMPHPKAARPIASTQPADFPIDDSIPPPPYDSAETWANGQRQGAKSSYPNEKTTTIPQPQSLSHPTPSSYPSLQAPPGTRLLHIYRDSLLGRDLTIKDSDKTTIMYTIAANHGFLFSEKPHMRFYRGPVEAQRSMQPVGTATFRSFSRTIDLTLHGRSVSMKSTSLLGYSYAFESGMGSLLWKGSNLSNDMTLTTPGKEWLAKFDANSFALEKRGTLEIVHWNIPDVGVDEIVISGMAMMEHMRREKGFPSVTLSKLAEPRKHLFVTPVNTTTDAANLTDPLPFDSQEITINLTAQGIFTLSMTANSLDHHSFLTSTVTEPKEPPL